MKNTRLFFLTAVVFVLFLGGCTVGPDYERPTVDSPTGWRIEYLQSADVANTLWWRQFDDPVLDDLIDEALQSNKDLLIATARVDEFLGRYGVTRADLFPRAGADGGY